MNKQQKTEALEFLRLALEYNCDTFHVFFDYSGHTDKAVVNLSIGGWYNKEKLTHTWIASIEELNKLKAEHDEKYAPENLAATKEVERLKEIKKLSDRIKELEGKSCQPT